MMPTVLFSSLIVLDDPCRTVNPLRLLLCHAAFDLFDDAIVSRSQRLLVCGVVSLLVSADFEQGARDAAERDHYPGI